MYIAFLFFILCFAERYLNNRPEMQRYECVACFSSCEMEKKRNHLTPYGNAT